VINGAQNFSFDDFTSAQSQTTSIPVVTAVSPASGPLAGGGTSVTITGTGFTGATAVDFGAAAATSVTVNSDTSITATAPAGASAGAVDVTVVTPNGTSATSPADQYTYTAPTGTATASLTDSGGNPIAGAAVTFRPASGQVTSATTASDGTASVVLAPGSYSVTMYYANGDQTKTLQVTANGPNAVSFSTVAVTAAISDPDSTDLAAASVAHAGNTGTFGPKTAVDSTTGQVTFQVLPGTNTFTAYDAGGYQTQTLTVTGPATVTFATVAVTVTVDKNGSPLTTALVAHAGNTGTYGPKTAVSGTGQVTFQVLPGTNTFTAWDGSAYTKQTLTITAATTTSISVA
jgi:hypothetical protein